MKVLSIYWKLIWSIWSYQKSAIKIQAVASCHSCTESNANDATFYIQSWNWEVSKGAKIRSRYNQIPHPTQDTNGKATHSQLDTTNESQEVSPFRSHFWGAQSSRPRRRPESWFCYNTMQRDRIPSRKRIRCMKTQRSFDINSRDWFWLVKCFNVTLVCHVVVHVNISGSATLKRSYFIKLALQQNVRNIWLSRRNEEQHPIGDWFWFYSGSRATEFTYFFFIRVSDSII